MVRAWRLTKRRHSHAAFDGEGARVYGGRWNSVGTRIAYASESRAVALLEVLVHLGSSKVLPAYDFAGIELPSSLIEVLDPGTLPPNWSDSPSPVEVQAIGDAWVSSGRSAVLAVPSTIIPEALNYLINPVHARFSELVVRSPEPFVFDRRLIGLIQRER